MSPHVPGSERLRRDLLSGRAVVAGVLSGTSADGVDVALLRFPAADVAPRTLGELAPPVCLAFATRPFPAGVADRVRAALDGEPLDARAIALLDRDLGRAFGELAGQVARERGLAPDLVGSHGQTLWHHDGREESGPATLQVGDGDEVAEAAGCAVACDFRRRDVAAGGQGAPLTALVDPVLFRHAPRPCAIVNLGGMANATLLGRRDELAGFDTGPAGALLDGLARRLLGEPFDADGAAAARGTADEELVAAELRHPYFSLPPPKSTGRDTFGEAWVDAWLARASGRRAEDVLATAAAFVAEHVAGGVHGVRGAPAAEGPRAIHLAGGGVHHARLVAEIARRSGLPAVSTAELGVDPDAREALAFGCLAVARVLELPATAPGVTGARPGRLLGKLCAAPGSA